MSDNHQLFAVDVVQEFRQAQDQLFGRFLLIERSVDGANFAPFPDGIFDDERQTNGRRKNLGRLNSPSIGAGERNKVAPVIPGKTMCKLLSLLESQFSQRAIRVAGSPDVAFGFAVTDEQQFGHGLSSCEQNRSLS